MARYGEFYYGDEEYGAEWHSTAKANIFGTTDRTLSAKANIRATRTVTAKASIFDTTSRTETSKSDVLAHMSTTKIVKLSSGGGA